MHIVPSERRGVFETWIGYENNNSQWDSWVHGGTGEEAFHYRLPKYETDALTDLLLDFIQKPKGERPFFAILSVQPPHDPYTAPAEWMGRHTPGKVQLRENVPNVPWVQERARRELAGCYGMIENIDWNLGRIRDTLARQNTAHHTHIIFFVITETC